MRRRRFLPLLLLPILAWLWLNSGSLLPDDPGLILQNHYGATQLLARDGKRLRWLYGPDHTRALPVPLTEISPKLIAATLALEDQRFFQHPGVDPLAILRAMGQNLMRWRKFSGASTLTQQLVKQMQPRPRTWTGKLVEALAALQLERKYPKTRILTWYLNWAPYGGVLRGVQAAAQGYFHKPAAELTWKEAAYLAVLPRAPGRLDPLLHPERALAHADSLLRVLHARGEIDQTTLEIALATPLRIAPQTDARLAPHLADWLTEKLAPLGNFRPLALQTTLDSALQETVNALLKVRLAQLADRYVGNGAVVVIDNETMEVRALVGSAQYSDAQRLGANNGALALRQPGSTMKAFVYAAAFAAPGLHLTPATLLPDLEAHFATPEGDYAPRNYGDLGGDHTAGPLRARLALASSVNIASVRLAEQVGVAPILDVLHHLGLTSLHLNPQQYGLALVLGDGEVTLLDLTGAFATLARLGLQQSPRWLAGVRLQEGPEVPLPREPPRRVLPASAAFQVLDILSDPVARQPAFGRGGPLELPFPVAAKTGTSKGFRDNWALGATPKYTVGVWVGNFDGTPMQDVSGVTGAAPLLRAVLLDLQGDQPPHNFQPPPELQHLEICPLSGGLRTPLCPTAVEEWFTADALPQPCTVHQEIALDRRNHLRAGPDCPQVETIHQVFAIFPPQFDQWAGQHLPRLPDFSPRCPTPNALAFPLVIAEPVEGATYVRDSQLPLHMQQISLMAHGPQPIHWQVDNRPLGTTTSGERTFWLAAVGQHRIVATDAQGQRAQVRVEVVAAGR